MIPVETEFGRKTQIHQSSCNKDFSCLEGDCPSFLTVIPPKQKRKRDRAADVPLPSVELRDPLRLSATSRVHAADDGHRRHRRRDRQPDPRHGGAARRPARGRARPDRPQPEGRPGGLRHAHLDASRSPARTASSAGGADLYLGFDVLGAANPKNLAVADPERTVAVVSTTAVPTGAMVARPEAGLPGRRRRAAARSTLATRREHERRTSTRSGSSEELFGDHMPANMLALGAAWQRGALPLSLSAHRAGDPPQRRRRREEPRRLRAGAARVSPTPTPSPRPPARPEPEPEHAEGLEGLLEVRVPELVAYQSKRVRASEYVEFVRRRRAIEQERTPGSTAIAEAVARHLFKLMAYKDEYEVARLHLAALPTEGQLLVPPAPADPARAGDEAQDQARPLVRARSSGCCARCAACAARRSTRSATRRSAASSAS